jgi:hypothetical protein
MTSRNDKLAAAAAALREAMPPAPRQIEELAPAEKPELARHAAKKKQRGENVHFYLNDEDKRLIRELSAYLAGQGERPSDSLIIRAVLRSAKTDSGLVKAFRTASQQDGRRKEYRNA